MTKITLADLGNLQNETTVVSTLNNNNALIEAAIENTVSRDGTSPNVMNASFDMNSNRILNLPEPISDLEPARLVDVRDGITGPQGPEGPQGPAGTDGTNGTNGAVAVSGTPTINQFANWTDATTLKGTSITGLVKGNGASAPSAAVSGTDYAPATTGTSILKAASGGFANAVAGTDYVAATSGSAVQKANGSGGLTAATSGTDYQAPIGTISGVAKGNGANTLTAATAGTDYVAPGTATAFTANQYFVPVVITDGANLAWTVSSAQKGVVTLGGNRTMNAVTGAVHGATYTLFVVQDATGSRTISWTTTGTGSFDFGTSGAPTLTTAASKMDVLTFEANNFSGTLKLRFTGIMRGFS